MSGDKKYYIETVDEKHLLLRVADSSEYAQKKTEYEIINKMINIGVSMSHPVDFGICNEGKSVYTLLSWIEGEEVETILSTLTEIEQYKLGIESGKNLRKIHGLPAPQGIDDWSIRYFRINEIVDYILGHQMNDGGWNCAWDSVHNRSVVSSVHTTISVLEAFADYERYGYMYRLDEIKQQGALGQEYLLNRQLFKSLKTGQSIHLDMISFHYPCRWKYDCFRALEYFVQIGYPYDQRMKDALNLAKDALKKGYINKGKSYPGKIHFPLESGIKGRFNTYRGLRILKYYDNKAYQDIIQMNFIYK